MNKNLIIQPWKIGFVIAVLLSPCLSQEAEEDGQKSSPEALAIYADAANYQKNSAFDVAAEEWEKFLKDHGDDPRATEARYNLGTCCYQLGKLDRAVTLLKQAIEKRDELERPEDAYFNLGSAIYSQALDKKPELFAQADKAFQQLLAEFPDGNYRDQGLFFRGESLYLQNNRVEAEKVYAELVDKHPDSPILSNGMYALGVTREELGKFEEAGEVYVLFQQKFKDHKLFNEVRMRQAETILQLGKTEEARALFAEVAALDNFDRVDNAVFRQAYCTALLGKFEEAANLFKKVVDDFPESQYAVEAKMASARAFYRASKFDVANELFETIKDSTSPFAAEAAHWQAVLRLKDGDPAGALKIIDAALPKAETSPFLVNLKFDRADAFYEMPERKRQSIAMYEAIFDEYANHALSSQSLYNAAYGAMELKQYEEGLRLAKKFLDKFNRGRLVADVKNIAGECALQLGNPDEAEAYFADIAKSDGEGGDANLNTSIRVRQGLTRYIKKDYQGAIKHLNGILGKLESADEKAGSHVFDRHEPICLGRLRCRSQVFCRIV